MEASETPPPQAPTSGSPPRFSAGYRLLCVLLTLALVVAGLFMGGFASEAGDSPNCGDRAAVVEEIEEEGFEDATCWDSDALKAASVILAWASVAALALSAILTLVSAITAQWRPLAMRLAIAAVVLGGLAILVAVID
jgi:hypothetical protein